MNITDRFLLRITCPGRTGLVAAITGFLADQDCFITELSQFDDIQTGQFFCRAEFCKPESGLTPEQFSNRFSTIRERFEMDWKFIDPSVPHRCRFDRWLCGNGANRVSVGAPNIHDFATDPVGSTGRIIGQLGCETRKSHGWFESCRPTESRELFTCE